LGRDARLGAEAENFLEKESRAETEEVVCELEDGAGADIAQMKDVLANDLEEREDGLEGGLLAPHHDGQGCRLRATDAAANRRVEEGDLALGSQSCEPSNAGDGVAAEVDVNGPGSRAGENPLLRKSDLVDLARPRQRSEDDAAQGSDLARAGCPGSA